MSFLEVKNLTAGYGGTPILENLSFRVESGHLVGLLGANGSGKTTLLKAICSIVPHRGRCLLSGTALETLSPRLLAQNCGYIPQRSGISIDVSVLDVVLMGFNPRLGLLSHPTSAMEKAALETLKTVGLDSRAQDNFLTLSEGQKQLCILARTLVSDCQLLLLDEPESALDFHFRYDLLDKIKSWILGGERAALVALHDPALALNECDRLLLLADGKIFGTITPKTDSIEKMEQMLGVLYGNVSLQRCKNRAEKEFLVMLREEP